MICDRTNSLDQPELAWMHTSAVSFVAMAQILSDGWILNLGCETAISLREQRTELVQTSLSVNPPWRITTRMGDLAHVDHDPDQYIKEKTLMNVASCIVRELEPKFYY